MSRRPGDLIIKDPNSVEPYVMDWTIPLAELGEDVEIAESIWLVVPLNGESPSVLVIDSDGIMDDNRQTQFYYSGGTLGARYRLTNRIETDSVPAVTLDKSVTIKVVQE